MFVFQSCNKGGQNFAQLIESPSDFDHLRVEITGIVHVRYRDVAIYRIGDPRLEHAIWLDWKKPDAALDGKRLTLSGNFNNSRKGFHDLYLGTFTEIAIETK